jgi:hypothetical protein
MMRIFDIKIYRDGGSVEFKLESRGTTRHVWLDTPMKGEPRKLKLDSSFVSRGAPQVMELLSDVDQWWRGIPAASQLRAMKALDHKGAFWNPKPDELQAIDMSRVLHVRDYLLSNYVEEKQNSKL